MQDQTIFSDNKKRWVLSAIWGSAEESVEDSEVSLSNLVQTETM